MERRTRNDEGLSPVGGDTPSGDHDNSDTNSTLENPTALPRIRFTKSNSQLSKEDLNEDGSVPLELIGLAGDCVTDPETGRIFPIDSVRMRIKEIEDENDYTSSEDELDWPDLIPDHLLGYAMYRNPTINLQPLHQWQEKLEDRINLMDNPGWENGRYEPVREEWEQFCKGFGMEKKHYLNVVKMYVHPDCCKSTMYTCSHVAPIFKPRLVTTDGKTYLTTPVRGDEFLRRCSGKCCYHTPYDCKHERMTRQLLFELNQAHEIRLNGPQVKDVRERDFFPPGPPINKDFQDKDAKWFTDGRKNKRAWVKPGSGWDYWRAVHNFNEVVSVLDYHNRLANPRFKGQSDSVKRECCKHRDFDCGHLGWYKRPDIVCSIPDGPTWTPTNIDRTDPDCCCVQELCKHEKEYLDHMIEDPNAFSLVDAMMSDSFDTESMGSEARTTLAQLRALGIATEMTDYACGSLRTARVAIIKGSEAYHGIGTSRSNNRAYDVASTVAINTYLAKYPARASYLDYVSILNSACQSRNMTTLYKTTRTSKWIALCVVRNSEGKSIALGRGTAKTLGEAENAAARQAAADFEMRGYMSLHIHTNQHQTKDKYGYSNYDSDDSTDQQPTGWWDRAKKTIRKKIIGAVQFIIGTARSKQLSGVLDNVLDGLSTACGGFSRLKARAGKTLEAILGCLVLAFIGFVSIRTVSRMLTKALEILGLTVPERMKWWNATQLALDVKMIQPELEQYRITLRYLATLDPEEAEKMHDQLLISMAKAITDEENFALFQKMCRMFGNEHPHLAHVLAKAVQTYSESSHEQWDMLDLAASLRESWNEWREACETDEREQLVRGDHQAGAALLSFLVSAIGCGFIGSWPTDVKEAVTYARQVTTLTSMGSMAGGVCDSIMKLFPGVIRYYYNFVFNQAELKKDMAKTLHMQAEHLCQYAKNGDVASTDEYREDLIKCQGDIVDLIHEFPAAGRSLGNVLRNISTAIQQCVSRNQGPLERPAPFVVWIYGNSNIGKSHAASALISAILGFKPKASEVATIQGSAAFYDGVSAQTKYIVMDECLLTAKKDAEGIVIDNWLTMCGNNRWSPPKSQAEEKRETCSPSLIIATSNQSHPDADVGDHEAILRRRNKVLKLQLTDRAQRCLKADGKMDWDKFGKKKAAVFQHLRAIEQHVLYPEGHMKGVTIREDKTKSLTDMAKILKKEYEKWTRDQNELVSNENDTLFYYRERRDAIKRSDKWTHQTKDKAEMANLKDLTPDFIKGTHPAFWRKYPKMMHETLAKLHTDKDFRESRIGQAIIWPDENTHDLIELHFDPKKEEDVRKERKFWNGASVEVPDTIEKETIEKDVSDEERDLWFPNSGSKVLTVSSDEEEEEGNWTVVLGGLIAVALAAVAFKAIRSFFNKQEDLTVTEEDLDQISGEHQNVDYKDKVAKRALLRKQKLVTGSHHAQRCPWELDVSMTFGGRTFPIHPIKDKYFYTNAHNMCDRKDGRWLISQAPYTVHHQGQSYSGVLFPSLVKTRGDADLIFINLAGCATLPVFRDMRRWYLSESLYPDVRRGHCYLAGWATTPNTGEMMVSKTKAESDIEGEPTHMSGWKYTGRTFKKGDCGRVCVSIHGDSRIMNKILGIHSVGSAGYGFAQAVSIEELDGYLDSVTRSPEITGDHHRAPASLPDLDANLQPLQPEQGELKITNQIHFIGRHSTIEPAPVKYPFDSGRLPAPLQIGSYKVSAEDPTVVMKDPLMAAVNKLGAQTDQNVDMDVLREASRDMAQSWSDKLVWNEPIRLLTDEEAIAGIPGYLPSVPDRTSAGYPLAKMGKTTSKSSHYRTLWDLNHNAHIEIKPTLAVELKKWHQYLANEISLEELDCRYNVAMKDETVKAYKTETGQVRLIFAAPFAHWIMIRRYFGPLLAAINNSWHRTSCAIGCNPSSWDLERMVQGMEEEVGATRGEACFFAGDGKEYDVRLLREFMDEAERIMVSLMASRVPGYDTDSAWKILQVTHDSPIAFGCYLLTLKHGHRSGNPMTGILNSMCHELMFRYAAKRIMPEVPFNGNISPKFVGDDNLCAVRKEHRDRFNDKSYAEEIAKINQLFTSEDKETPLTGSFRTVTQCNFLGCEIQEVGGSLCGVLEKKRVYNLLVWVKRTESDACTNALQALKYFSPRPKMEWDDLHRIIKDAFRDAGKLDALYEVLAVDQRDLKNTIIGETTFNPAWGVYTLPQVHDGFEEVVRGQHHAGESSGSGSPAVAESGPLEKEGFTVFTDPSKAAPTVAPVRRHRRKKQVKIKEPEYTYKTGLESSRNIARFDWNQGQDTSTELFSIGAPFEAAQAGLPAAADDTSLAGVPFRTMLYMIGGVEFEVSMTGPRTAAGQITMYWMPLQRKERSVTAPRFGLYQHQHMTPTRGKKYRLLVDYVHVRDMLNTFAGTSQAGGSEVDEELGSFHIGVFFPLLGASSVSVSVWMRFILPKFTGPKPSVLENTEAELECYRHYRKSGLHQKTAVVERKGSHCTLVDVTSLPPRPTNDRDSFRGEHQGNSSSTTINYDIDGGVVGEVSAEAQAEAEQVISPETSVDASQGMDLREHRGGGIPVILNNPGLSKSTGNRTTNSMQLGQKAMRVTDIDNFGTLTDETALAWVAKRPIWVFVNWSTTDPPATLLASGSLNLANPTGANQNNPATLCARTGMFHRYKALTFYFCTQTNEFFNGALRFCVSYGAPGPPVYDAANVTYSEMLNIGEGQTFFKSQVQTMMQQPYLKSNWGLASVDPVQDSTLGHWALYVVNPLTISDTIGTNTCRVAYCIIPEDLVVDVPNAMASTRFTLRPGLEILKKEEVVRGEHQAGDVVESNAATTNDMVEPNESLKIDADQNVTPETPVTSAVVTKPKEKKKKKKPHISGQYKKKTNIFPKAIDSFIDLGRRMTKRCVSDPFMTATYDDGSQWTILFFPIMVPLFLARFYRLVKGGVNFAVHWPSGLAERRGAVFFQPTPFEAYRYTVLDTDPPAVTLTAFQPVSEFDNRRAVNSCVGSAFATHLVPPHLDNTAIDLTWESTDGTDVTSSIVPTHSTAGAVQAYAEVGSLEWGYGAVNTYNCPFQHQFRAIRTTTDDLEDQDIRNVMGVFCVATPVVNGQYQFPEVRWGYSDDFALGVWSPTPNANFEPYDFNLSTATDGFAPIPYGLTTLADF